MANFSPAIHNDTHGTENQPPRETAPGQSVRHDRAFMFWGLPAIQTTSKPFYHKGTICTGGDPIFPSPLVDPDSVAPISVRWCSEGAFPTEEVEPR